MQESLDLITREKKSFFHRMYCSNIANVTVSYEIPSEEVQKSYPSYKSTDFKVQVESIFVLGTDCTEEYRINNSEVIGNLEQRASLELEMKLYWKDM